VFSLRQLRAHWFVRDALIPFLVTRIALLIIGLLSLHMLDQPRGLHAWQVAADGHLADCSDANPLSAERPLINMASRWDSGWLLSIASHGYKINPGHQSNTACFPLYPLAMRATNWLIHGRTQGDMLFAGILVSNIALLAALAYLIALARLEFSEAVATRAAWYLLVFPATLYLSAVYTESLFTAFLIGAVYRARRAHWWRAGLLGGCAAATRFNGFLVIIPIAMEYAATCQWRWRNIRWPALALFIIPAGAGAFILLLWYQVGDPLAYLQAQGIHARHLAAPWTSFVPFLTGNYQPVGAENSILDLAAALFLIVAVAWSWRVVRPGHAAFATITAVLILSTGSLASTIRYCLPVYPIFLVLAVVGQNQLFDRCYLAVAAGFSAFFMALFATWHWVA